LLSKKLLTFSAVSWYKIRMSYSLYAFLWAAKLMKLVVRPCFQRFVHIAVMILSITPPPPPPQIERRFINFTQNTTTCSVPDIPV
jgi:hypothetical protein